ncbi:MAG: PilW family protein [Collimonas sp.]|uniref:PilW family protein n=1 Tax=Collimonas sp. TaxID=1963772 RepID=UPI0032661951
MKHIRKHARGVTLIELMVSMVIGLFLSGAVISIYLAEIRIYQSSTSQAGIQNSENAIAALVTPLVRSAGFNGCATLSQSISNLNSGGSPPLGTLGASPNMLVGYEASSSGALTIAQDNSANDAQASDWSPALDAALVGSVEASSDVLVLLGAAPGTSPVGVTAAPVGGTALMLQNTGGLAAGQIGMVSDCLKASVFQITAVTSSTVSHAAGSGAMANSASVLSANYAPGSQFIPLQQTALYVAHGPGDQSILVRATYSGGTWSAQPLVPGVEAMQVLYGAGSNGLVTQYVVANAVADWTKVYAVRLGFLLQGQLGSGTTSTIGSRQFTVLGNIITAPADGRLRHVYEMTVHMRNAI